MTDELVEYAQKLEQYNKQMENDLQYYKEQTNDMARSNRVFTGQDSENLIIYQLSMKEELEKIYHLLRGDRQISDGKGNTFYVESPDNEKPFNDYGVQRIMNKLSMYLHKNIILSYHLEPEEFYPSIENVMKDISDYILLSHCEMGMDTDEKVNMYPFIIDAIKDNIRSAYRRSLFGRELNSLRSARIVTQRDGELINNHQNQLPLNTDKKQWWKPW